MYLPTIYKLQRSAVYKYMNINMKIHFVFIIKIIKKKIIYYNKRMIQLIVIN